MIIFSIITIYGYSQIDFTNCSLGNERRMIICMTAQDSLILYPI